MAHRTKYSKTKLIPKGSNSSSSTPEQCAKRKRTGPSSRKRGRKSPPVSSSDDQLDSIGTCQAPLKYSVVPLPVSAGQENVPPNIVVNHYNNSIPSLCSDQVGLHTRSLVDNQTTVKRLLFGCYMFVCLFVVDFCYCCCFDGRGLSKEPLCEAPVTL